MKASRGVAVEICKNVKKKALEDERQKEKHKEKKSTDRKGGVSTAGVREDRKND